MHSSAMVSSALALSPSDLPAWSLGNLGGGQSPHRWEVSGETQEMNSMCFTRRRSADMHEVDERPWVKAFWDSKLDGVA